MGFIRVLCGGFFFLYIYGHVSVLGGLIFFFF